MNPKCAKHPASERKPRSFRKYGKLYHGSYCGACLREAYYRRKAPIFRLNWPAPRIA